MRTPQRVEQHNKEIELKRAKALRDAAKHTEPAAVPAVVEKVAAPEVAPIVNDQVETVVDDTAELAEIESMLADQSAEAPADETSEDAPVAAPQTQQKAGKRR